MVPLLPLQNLSKISSTEIRFIWKFTHWTLFTEQKNVLILFDLYAEKFRPDNVPVLSFTIACMTTNRARLLVRLAIKCSAK